MSDLTSEDERRLVLSGEMDAATVPQFESVVARVCEGRAATVVLDLRRLDFLDSSGLHAIESAHRACADHGHELRIIPGPRKVQLVFELAGLSDRLPFL